MKQRKLFTIKLHKLNVQIADKYKKYAMFVNICYCKEFINILPNFFIFLMFR